ncbi:MAG: RNA polymerase sigma factor [Bryobacteraceae bacterium]
MEQADALSLPAATWETEFLEDTSLRRIVLDLYDRDHLGLRRYVAFLGADPETAQEVVQESFLRVHQHLLSGGDRTNLRAWLYRVAHNLLRNLQTSARATRIDYLPDLPASGDIHDTGMSPEEEMLASERDARFKIALEQLSPAQRECLALRTRGLKYREIGEVLDLSVSTVGEHIQRGLEKLKELL